MADNRKTLQQRMQTVRRVSKITQAMKLVAVSKLQSLQSEVAQFSQRMEAFLEMPTRPCQAQEGQASLVIMIAPDLGMASKYNQTLYQALVASDFQEVAWLGNQFYERVASLDQVDLVNDRVASDSLEIAYLYDWVNELATTRVLSIAVPHMEGQEVVVDFKTVSLELDPEGALYEPNYQEVNDRFRSTYTFLILYEAYYQAKYCENMVRQIAMEAATENAEEMQEDLVKRYNRIRQEEITLEILELSQES